MQRVLILLTSTYPFGTGETFVANEVPYLHAAFDELIIVSNDIDSEVRHSLPEGVTCLRISSEPSAAEKLRSSVMLLEREPRAELRRVPSAYGLPVTRPIRNTIVLSWANA